MLRNIYIICLLLVAAVTSSCNVDGVITTTPPPVIHLDSESGIYTVKTGKALIISPTYEFAENAEFSWFSGGMVLGTEPSLSFSSEETGEIYITLRVVTEFGSDEEEIKVEVVDLEIPYISYPEAENGYNIAVGTELTLTPSIKTTSLPVEYEWKENGKTISTELSYTFKATEEGSFVLEFTASNEDGSDTLSIDITVFKEEEMPMSWTFEKDEYSIVSGNTLLLKPVEIHHAEDALFTWYIDDNPVKSAQGAEEGSFYIFDIAQEGTYKVKVEAVKSETNRLEHTLTVNVLPAEVSYYRPKNENSLAVQTAVFEYTPAPGQFINETKTGGFDGTQTTPESAAQYAQNRMQNDLFVSLGGFGGYIVVGFDHSIDATGGYDFAVKGNSFDGSSEPGIVYVMQDENGNGMPDDTWYELAGSETGKEETIRDYSVTYYRPSSPQMPVTWTDNQGGSGEIDYLAAFHTQDYYYPAWIEEDSYTLTGTKLKEINYDQSGNGSYWVQPAYGWGYADNFSATDGPADSEAIGIPSGTNYFKISNAIDRTGAPFVLEYIDFIKVQTACNTKSGWLGEQSTEVFGFYDLSIEKK